MDWMILKHMVAQGKVLAQKYHVTTTNPPYMAISSGSGKLNEYVKKYYPDSKRICLLYLLNVVIA